MAENPAAEDDLTGQAGSPEFDSLNLKTQIYSDRERRIL